MATGDLEYSVDKEIAQFFDKMTATRAACDAYAAEHLGGDVIPVAVQAVYRKFRYIFFLEEDSYN
ncbi:hypothetical protein APSETT444_010354 [Aspergillus pseudonomiae]